MRSDASTFNLIDEPWLPVQRRSGSVERIQPWRITERIDDDPIVALAWPRPDFNGAAHELLIGLLSTAAAPDDDDAWKEWWLEPPPPAVLQRCFSAVARAFDLDGGGPRFLQDLDPLEGAESKEVAALLMDAPGAQTLRNNADLFVKRGGAPALSRAAAAMALYTLNSYAPSGGAGHRTSLRGGGPMTTLVVASHPGRGHTLWGRLWPNVETREQVAARAATPQLDEAAEKIFPWLAPCRTSNPNAGGGPTTPSDVHPLQVYWGMPRRIRLVFENGDGRRCGLTGASDAAVASRYRTRNYGINYSDGFEHPLTPYYRQKLSDPVKLPVHPNPGGISYRLWPGLVVRSSDQLRDPAQVVRHWPHRLATADQNRFTMFGYDMDNMKARAWIESEMPLWQLGDTARGEAVEYFVQRATAGAANVARLVKDTVRAAIVSRPKGAPSDYGFVTERFFRDTEGAFHEALEDAIASIKPEPAGDDPTLPARERWAPTMERAALRLFDECAPSDGLEDRDMHRHVKVRFSLWCTLRGRGRAGQSLFDGDLGIVSPETRRKRGRSQESPS